MVAGIACHGQVFAGQPKRRAGVVETVQVRKAGVGAVMLGMALAATHSLGQPAVQGLMVVELATDVGVAVEAAGCHGVRAPRRGVAGGAVAADFGVGSDAAVPDSYPAPRAQLTGAKHAAAGGPEDDGDNPYREEGCDPSRVETAKGSHGFSRYFRNVA
jgi:hypothetical protein